MQTIAAMFSTRLDYYNSETEKSWQPNKVRVHCLLGLVGNMRSEKHKKLKRKLIIVETGYRKLLTFYTGGVYDTSSV